MQRFEGIWSQPATVVFDVTDLLAAYNTVAANVEDIIVSVDGVEAWEFRLSTHPSNVLWEEDDALVRLVINTTDFDGVVFTKAQLRCRVALVLDGDNITTYEPLPSHSAHDTRLRFTNQSVANLDD